MAIGKSVKAAIIRCASLIYIETHTIVLVVANNPQKRCCATNQFAVWHLKCR